MYSLTEMQSYFNSLENDLFLRSVLCLHKKWKTTKYTTRVFDGVSHIEEKKCKGCGKTIYYN